MATSTAAVGAAAAAPFFMSSGGAPPPPAAPARRAVMPPAQRRAVAANGVVAGYGGGYAGAGGGGGAAPRHFAGREQEERRDGGGRQQHQQQQQQHQQQQQRRGSGHEPRAQTQQQQHQHRPGPNPNLIRGAPGTPPLPRPTRESVLRRLSEALMRRSLTMIDMSQRGLQPSDARLMKLALLQNASLSVLKLGYNDLGDDGVSTLASGIAAHGALKSLDLGFNHVGDAGCTSLASSLLSARAPLHTLYLAGNCIGPAGARSLADVVRAGCGLRRLHMTGNGIGPGGVGALADAFAEDEARRGGGLLWDGDGCVRGRAQNGGGAAPPPPPPQAPSSPPPSPGQGRRGVKELFLGGTGMGRPGCEAVGRLVERSASLRVLSLANCDLGDGDACLLAESLRRNRRGGPPLEAIQLSFNRLTCAGIEALMNAVWGSRTLRELRLDNNSIGDRGAQVVSAVLSSVETLTSLDLGFNSITSGGMKVLMKAVADSRFLSSLSISGNPVDTGAAKAVAYALAYNRSLRSLFLDHCSVGHEGQRHVTAGIVSNSGTRLHTLTGFRIGANAVSLGLPAALEQWTNEQVLKFIHLMWERMRQDQDRYRMEKEIDPLHLLPSVPDGNPRTFSGPLDPATVVAVAGRAYASLGSDGGEALSRRSGRPREPWFESPLAEDAIMLEATDGDGGGGDGDGGAAEESDGGPSAEDASGMDVGEGGGGGYATTTTPDLKISVEDPAPAPAAEGGADGPRSPPPSPVMSFDERRRRIVEWLCRHIQYLNDLSQVPFDSAELWRLHQHFFAPSVQDCGGGSGSVSPSPHAHPNSADGYNGAGGSSLLSQPRVVSASTQSSEGQVSAPASEPSFPSGSSAAAAVPPARGYMGTLPMLKRKVSYRIMNEALLTSSSARPSESHRADGPGAGAGGKSISKMIEDVSGQSMQPRSKRARRNRSRISFVPRIKARLDSHLDACHHKALVLMRQLQFVERALLNGHVYPLETGAYRHLSGTLAADAEMILIDMT